jgi:hypothetical protein
MPKLKWKTPFIAYGFFAIAAGLLAWHFWRRRHREKQSATVPDIVWPGRDSEFYLIENRLQEAGLRRRRGEAMGDWVERVSSKLAPEIDVTRLRELLQMHYRYRFDAEGLNKEERAILATKVQEWLEDFGSRLESSSAV